ncbi:MAG: ferredoxin family protein [Planctomycetes bacterium]|nr:ferredoxin family protein [Planctomycetota bacterium]
MAYIVTENCQGCMFTDCVAVCPVDCFHGNPTQDKMIYIDPEACIDCGACVPECPVEAIFADSDVPEGQKQYTAINAERCKSGELENITAKRDPLGTAEDKKKKLGF